MKKKKAVLGIVIGIVAVAIIIGVVLLAINLIKKGSDDVGEIYYYQTPVEHIAEENGISFADNEILVVASDGVSKKDIEQLAEKYGAEIVGYIEATGDYQWSLKDSYTLDDLDSLIQTIQDESAILSVSLNCFEQMNEDSVDYDVQIGSNDKWQKDIKNSTDIKGVSWGVEAIKAPEVWTWLNQNKNIIEPVRVGLIDSGFDETHEDLNYAETFYNSSADDHGTLVSGVLAASANNNIGVCGVYPYGANNIYAVSSDGVLDARGNGVFYYSTMYQKIGFAELILRGVKVINSSQNNNRDRVNIIEHRKNGWESQLENLNDNADVLGNFLNRLIQKGYDFVIVSAAGNSSKDEKTNLEAAYNSYINAISEEKYPAVYNRIIVVGALNKKFNISDYSNAGTRTDIYAPGDSIYGTLPNSTYGAKDGTSFASPMVAGAAATVWSINNKLNGPAVKVLVTQSVSIDHTDPGLLDFAMASRIAFRTREYTSDRQIEKTSNGAILGFVVDPKDLEVSNNTVIDGAIENAEVVIKNADTNEEINPAVVTDSNGHFEAILPVGNYTLTVCAAGYQPYEWSETIKVEAGQVHYLSDWIKIDKIPKALVPESAVEIYLNNKEIWMAYPEYFPMNGYSYGFLDLDFDGTLELVRNICDGSGRFSDNAYFKINMTDYSVYELKFASNENDEVVGDGYDYSLNDEYPKLLRRKADGSFVYYCLDFLRIMTGDYISYYGTLNLTDDTIVSDTLFAEHHQEAGLYNNSPSVDEYFHYRNNNEAKISKSVFDEEMTAYFKEMEDVELTWSLISGKDLETAVYSKQKELMTEAYKKFGYKGFSFEQLDLIEPKLKLNRNENSPISKDEIKKLYIEANSLFDGWVCHGWEPKLDFNDTITENGWEYARVVSGRFHTVDELEKELKNYFSTEIYKDRLDHYYIMHDNKLYGTITLAQGGDITPDKYGLSISSQTDNECVFIVTNYYSNVETFDSEYRIIYENGRWIFVDEFIENMYLNENSVWIN